MKYFILFGPPGAGKGTQATAMVEKYNLRHISTGALLRQEIAAGSELGLKAKALIDAGALVPDEIVEGMIESEFRSVKNVDGFLLDGFPRTTEQAKALDRILAGIELSDGLISADELEYIDDNDHRKLGIEIHSGKNRIVRRIFESLGYSVKALDRVYFAGLTKKGLKRGAWRFLTQGEVNVLKMGAYV